jgi:phenylacetate-CoA ligase
LDNPVVIGFTANDLKAWARLKARELTAVGVKKDDVVQVSLSLGKMAGPFGIQLGTELIGASFIPLSGGKLPSQVRIMRDFRTSTLVTTPTFALGLADTMEQLGIEPMDLSLKYCILCSEPWSEATRDELESRLHITATDSYGLMEIFGPGVSWECSEREGLHIPEDHLIPEIIDPKSGEPLPPGTEGELVWTTLSKEAFPLIRFRTGDVASISMDACDCGRTHCRISRVFKRCDGIIVMRGTSINPDHIGQILAMVNKDLPKYQIIVDTQDGQDQLTVLIEISETIFFDEMSKQRNLVDSFHQAVSEFLGWEVKIKLVEPESLDSDSRVLDKRSFR